MDSGERSLEISTSVALRESVPSHCLLLPFASAVLLSHTRQRASPAIQASRQHLTQNSSCDTFQEFARVVGLALKQHPSIRSCRLGQRVQPLFPGREAWLQNYRDRVDRVDLEKTIVSTRPGERKHCSHHSIRDPAIVLRIQNGDLPSAGTEGVCLLPQKLTSVVSLSSKVPRRGFSVDRVSASTPRFTYALASFLPASRLGRQ